jgi:hypothetical protein
LTTRLRGDTSWDTRQTKPRKCPLTLGFPIRSSRILAAVPRSRSGGAGLWLAEVAGEPVPRFEKVEREPPADVVVIEGDDL